MTTKLIHRITGLVWLCAASLNEASAAATTTAVSPLRKAKERLDIVTNIRHYNITTSITNYNHCNTKCVTSIATGHRSGCQGFAGDDCSYNYEICPDTVTQCFGPMSVCVDDVGSQSTYHCDCKFSLSIERTETSVMKDMIIQDCLDRITEVCEKDQTVSLYSFCTNGGQCVNQIEEGEPHPGCFCPGRFVGRHCEKRRGTGPEYRIEPTTVNVNFDEMSGEIVVQETEDRDFSAWMINLIVVLSVAVGAFLIYATVLYKRLHSERYDRPDGDDKSKDAMSIHIHVPVHGASDNISALEMH